MNRKQFEEFIATNFGINKDIAEAIVGNFAEAISMAILDGHTINIESFGTFGTNHVTKKEKNKNKNSSHVQTKLPYFKPSLDLKLICN